MKSIEGVGLEDVRQVYSGPEGDLWELLMGEQIHVGGLASSLALADKAGIGEGMHGIDLCCCSGAGMRFLVRFRDVAGMQGVDATKTVVDRGRERCEQEGFHDRITFHLRDACDSGLPDGGADFVWGEDAWCSVEDKEKLIAEAARLIRPGGTIAFTDWVEGETALNDDEAERFLRFMKFPNIITMEEYRALLEARGCKLEVIEDTDVFAPYFGLYLGMLNHQLTYDVLKIIRFDTKKMISLGSEMEFVQGLAKEGKITQGRIIARKPE